MTTIDISCLLDIAEDARFDKLREILDSTNDSHFEFAPPVGREDTICFNLMRTQKVKVRPIRLKARHIDFSNWKFKVTSQSTDRLCFFEIEKRESDDDKKVLSDIHITKSDIDAGDFRHIPELAHGKKLLQVKDLKEWTVRTDPGAEPTQFYREDVFLIEDGIATNAPISPYNTPTTAINYKYCDVTDDQPVVMENLTFLRDPDVQHAFGLFSMAWQNDVTFRNIHIGFYKDCTTNVVAQDYAFNIYYCTNVTFKNVSVNQTFSQPRKSGYAFYMQALYNVTFHNCSSSGNWGVIGSFMLNRVYLANCRLNRFDIHCYGKDVKCTNCTFENTLTYVNEQGHTVDNPNRYNQFSSFYGTLHFQNCTFNNFYPVLLEPSYHTYTGFNIIMENCTMTRNPLSAIVLAGYLESGGCRRTEFHKTCWPDIHIIDITLSGYTPEQNIYLFWLNDRPVNPQAMSIGFISELSVTLSRTSSKPKFHFCNHKELVTDRTINALSCYEGATIQDLPTSRQT